LLRIDGASLNTCGQIRLTWTNVANETKYEVERDGSIVPALETGADVLSATDRNIAQNTSYSYRVRACNAFGCSAWSNPPQSAINQSPSADFSWTPQSIRVNQPILFTDGSVAYGGIIASRLWTFQDGNPATVTGSRATTTTKFINANPTPKQITLRVTDSNSRVCSASKDVPVKSGSAPPGWNEVPPE
jgi:PKD repeat protein